MEEKEIFRIISIKDDDSFRLKTDVDGPSDYTSLVAGIAQILYEEPRVFVDVLKYVRDLHQNNTDKDNMSDFDKLHSSVLKDTLLSNMDDIPNKIKS